MLEKTLLGVALASRQIVVTSATRPDAESPAVTYSTSLDHVLETGDAPSVIEFIVAWVEKRKTEPGVPPAEALGISIGGHVDSAAGRVVLAHDVVMDGEHWLDEDIGAELSDRLGIPVSVHNDVDCMTAYYLQDDRGRRAASMAVVYLQKDLYGMGCGIAIGKRLILGASGGAGELGHMIVLPDGPRCHCGTRGCLAAAISSGNILRDVNWGRVGSSRVSHLQGAASLADSGDTVATHAFSSAGRFLGQGLAGLINILNPDLIVLGGPKELVREGEGGSRSAVAFLDGCRDTIRRYSYSDLAETCELVISPLDLTVGAVGSSLLAAGVVQTT